MDVCLTVRYVYRSVGVQLWTWEPVTVAAYCMQVFGRALSQDEIALMVRTCYGVTVTLSD